MHKFPEIATRLKRAQGHLLRVIEMLEAGRFPVEAAISKTVPLAEAAEALEAWNAAPQAFTKIHVQVS